MTAINPNVYQALVIGKALEVYDRHRIKVNRAYTPSRMMRMAESITGEKFASRDYAGAAKALRTWANKQERP